ncbi:MAG: DUF4178 domain-containing protein [Spirochaetota bacterium]
MSVFKVVNCPSCGGPQDIKNPAIVQATCEYCNTVFLLDKDAVKDTGKKSKLMPAISGFAIGLTGKLGSKTFEVMGRVQYKYTEKNGQSDSRELGKWDEWYVELNDSSTVWISEDMGELILETPAPAKDDINEETIEPGMNFQVEGKDYQIKETGTAICSGAEGTLPFQVIPDETYVFADGISLTDNSFLTVEFDELRESNIFVGNYIAKDDISYKKEIQAEQQSDNEAFRCPNCGSPLEMHDMNVSDFSVTCGACGSLSQFTENTGVVMGKVEPELAEVFTLELGATGTLQGREWTIVSRQRKEWYDDGESGYETEYLLYNSDDGYLWLGEAEGHYSLSQPSDEKPYNSLLSGSYFPKANVKVGNSKYQFFESGELTVTYVDGVLPWFCSIGDVTQYADVISPPFTITEEQLLRSDGSTGEIEYFKGTYLDYQEVEEGFGVSLNKPYGVGPAQPYKSIPYQKLISFSSFAIGFLLLINSCGMSSRGKPVLNEVFYLAKLKKKEAFTKPFTIAQKDQTLHIKLRANFNNSWASLGVALFDTKKERIISDEDVGIEYYSGYEGGESWSEGSRSSNFYWKIKEPGTYRLMIAAPQSNISSFSKSSVALSIKKGVRKAGWLTFWSWMWFIQPLLFWFRKKTFETSRWSDVIESDDD